MFKAILKIVAGLLVIVAAFGYSLQRAIDFYNLAHNYNLKFSLIRDYDLGDKTVGVFVSASFWYCGIAAFLRGLREVRNR